MPSYNLAPHQLLSYKRLFKKFCVSPDDRKYQVIMTDPNLVGDRKIFDSRLGMDELKMLMETMGPPLTSSIVKSIILKYDSSCTGFLDFEDFVHFMDDFHELDSADASETMMGLQYNNNSFLGADAAGANRFQRQNFKMPSFCSFKSEVSLIPEEEIEEDGTSNRHKKVTTKKTILIRIMDLVGLEAFAR